MSRLPLPIVLFALAACGSDSVHLGGELAVDSQPDAGSDGGDGTNDGGGDPGGPNNGGRPDGACSRHPYDDVCGQRGRRTPKKYSCDADRRADGAVLVDWRYCDDRP